MHLYQTNFWLYPSTSRFLFQVPLITYPVLRWNLPGPSIMSLQKHPEKYYPFDNNSFPRPSFKSYSNYPKYMQNYPRSITNAHPGYQSWCSRTNFLVDSGYHYRVFLARKSNLPSILLRRPDCHSGSTVAQTHAFCSDSKFHRTCLHPDNKICLGHASYSRTYSLHIYFPVWRFQSHILSEFLHYYFCFRSMGHLHSSPNFPIFWPFYEDYFHCFCLSFLGPSGYEFFRLHRLLTQHFLYRYF